MILSPRAWLTKIHLQHLVWPMLRVERHFNAWRLDLLARLIRAVGDGYWRLREFEQHALIWWDAGPQADDCVEEWRFDGPPAAVARLPVILCATCGQVQPQPERHA